LVGGDRNWASHIPHDFPTTVGGRSRFGASCLYAGAAPDRRKNDTLNTRAELIPERQSSALGEGLGSSNKVGMIHERRQSRNLRAFRYRSHGTVRERPYSTDCPAGPPTFLFWKIQSAILPGKPRLACGSTAAKSGGAFTCRKASKPGSVKPSYPGAGPMGPGSGNRRDGTLEIGSGEVGRSSIL
jgi:hypothetical protein